MYSVHFYPPLVRDKSHNALWWCKYYATFRREDDCSDSLHLSMPLKTEICTLNSSLQSQKRYCVDYTVLTDCVYKPYLHFYEYGKINIKSYDLKQH